MAIDFRTQTEQVELTFAQQRHFAVLSSLFGALAGTALGLAAASGATRVDPMTALRYE